MTIDELIKHLITALEEHSGHCKQAVSAVSKVEPEILFVPTEIKLGDDISITADISDTSLVLDVKLEKGVAGFWMNKSEFREIQADDNTWLTIHHLGAERETITYNDLEYLITVLGVAILTHHSTKEWPGTHKCELSKFLALVRVRQARDNLDTLQNWLSNNARGKLSAITQTLKTMLGG